MKLSLTLLVIFGLVAFIGAAPAEEDSEIPEEPKTEDAPEQEEETPEQADENVEDEMEEDEDLGSPLANLEVDDDDDDLEGNYTIILHKVFVLRYWSF
ncbi:acidic leucine-rich nuclear phosphoprotein 32 family member B [Exaiptasia diaphana]|uniref:Uncharacterized protein n=1 Tax=Exaiptasia diaphana TaxID=2652724 RepID=A0A913X2N2_EXADI|nr:acidic leucine-rich nuclear phosphoprotein 32 family member B [Exaiptasia diaphana]KXJ05330.1 hypothetical protein AC249_AIPGENE26266 [Exaiptasia diaphana]